MGKLSMDDVFKALAKPLPDFEIKPGKTALLLIDIQNLVSSKPLLQEALGAGLPEREVREALREYDERVKKAVKNARRILQVCRKKGYDIVHIKLGAQTSNPRHTAKINRKADFIVPMDAEKGRFLDEVKPAKGELIFPKTNGGAFTGTNLDFVLRNMDIDSIIVTGFLTDQCVLATAICGGDIGYDVLLIEDACTGTTKENHDAVVKLAKDVFLKVKSTAELMRML
ncbi:MAG: isochorismatase family cysteine hydrolase [Candidatus Bathyarchaeia archaeon]|jgi:nicotinamidase-related amidase